jgi:hypothetical protein
MGPRSFRLLLALLLALLPFGTALAAPRSDDSIVYRVAKGDDLYTLAERNFRKPADYIVVQRQNQVVDPRRLPVGMILTIPRSLLRQEPIDAVVQSFRGVVLAGAGQNLRQVELGMRVREGYRIETGSKSFITLRLPDGSNVALPSQTSLRVERLRRTLMAGSVERSFRIEKGSAGATVTPMEDPHSEFNFSTPAAVSAVRGTRFRVRYNPDEQRAASEVLEGKVAFAAADGTAEQMLPAGFGIANGLSGPLPLLPPPDLVSPGRVQDDQQLHFELKPLAGAKSYHLQIAADAGFIDVLDETTAVSPEAVLEALGNGDYFVRATATDANGLEGLPATYAFQRRLNRIEASAEEVRSGRYRQYLFRWRAPDAHDAQYRFQLSATPDGTKPLVDEAGLKETAFVVTDLPPDTYYWRVETLDIDQGRVYEKWSPFQELRIEGAR